MTGIQYNDVTAGIVEVLPYDHESDIEGKDTQKERAPCYFRLAGEASLRIDALRFQLDCWEDVRSFAEEAARSCVGMR